MSFRISVLSCIFKPNAIASAFQYNLCFLKLIKIESAILLNIHSIFEFKPGLLVQWLKLRSYNIMGPYLQHTYVSNDMYLISDFVYQPRLTGISFFLERTFLTLTNGESPPNYFCEYVFVCMLAR